MQHHSVDLYGDLKANNSAGIAGQFLQTQGSNNQVVWADSVQESLYYYTDKPVQTTTLAVVDLTWNVGAADVINGVVFDGSTQFTLTANRLYNIQATIIPTSSLAAYSVSIVDTANNPVGSINHPAAGIGETHTHAIALFKPLVDTVIKVRLTNAVTITFGTQCFLSIETAD